MVSLHGKAVNLESGKKHHEVVNKTTIYCSGVASRISLISKKFTFKSFGSASEFNMLESNSRLFRATTRCSFFSSADAGW